MALAAGGERFTEVAWAAISPWRGAVESMPFIRALADGSLPADAFAFYLAQDAAYLIEFSRVLSVTSAAAPDTEAQAFYAISAQTALIVETNLHRDWLRGRGTDTLAPASPVTTAYTNHLLAACVGGSYPVLAAAVLPCYWLYAHIADVLLRQAGDLTDHPYQQWIATYADPEFQEATRTACALTDRAAEGVEPGTRSRMLTAFERSAMHEYLFFDQGINQPAWPAPPVA